MNLEIFDKVTRQRLDLIKTYQFLQYVDPVEGSGKFSIKIPSTESSLSSLNAGNYIWFEKDVVGIIKYRKESSEDDSTVLVEGPLCKKLLDYRIFDKTSTYTGHHSNIVKRVIEEFFISPDNPKRHLDGITMSQNPVYLPSTNSVKFQATGKPVGSGLESFLSTANLEIAVAPIFSNYDEEKKLEANISSFEVRVIKPTDRTIGNSEGNSPVVFSTELDNLARLLHEKDDSLFCSMAYVAGEGEGEERSVVEVGDYESSGIDRIETYVDARDIQRIQQDGTSITEDEYTLLLKQRGEEQLKLYSSSTLIQGTAIMNGMYVFERDYTKGDFVSLMDKKLGLIVDVPISSVICSSSQSTGTVYDFEFGHSKATVKRILRTKGVI